MQIDIGSYDPARRSVSVTFIEGDLTHSRDVNACLDGDGEYDITATALRVEDVARGVAVKIAAGAIRAPDPLPEPPAAVEAVD